MIIPNSDKAKDDEISVWTIATGILKLTKKRSRKAVDYIKDLDGFVGVHPCFPKGMLWLFDTKNNAIRAREDMESVGIKTGDNICEVFISKEYKKGD